MTSATIPAVNPHDDSFYQNPFPSYSMLRAEATACEIPDTPGLFFITTWPYVRKVLSAGVTQEATDIEWRVLEQIEQGDIVMNERVDCFLVNDTWIEIPIAALFKVRDGKICLWRDYFDLDTYRKQRAS